MAQKVHITLEDDLDGGSAAETVAFGLDGRTYEIDLNAKTAKALREAMAKYVAAGRRASGSRSAASACRWRVPFRRRSRSSHWSPAACRAD